MLGALCQYCCLLFLQMTLFQSASLVSHKWNSCDIKPVSCPKGKKNADSAS